MQENKVAIIILNKSNNEILFNCLNSIKEKTTFPNYHIYIGDTGSTIDEKKDIVSFLKDKFSENKNASLIEFDYYNFAKNNNEIVNKHIGQENLILFCNNDIKLIDDCITEAVKMYNRNKDVTGTIGFKLLFGNDKIQHAGQLLVTKNMQFVGVTHRGLNSDKKEYSDRSLVIGNTAALMMTPTELFKEINGFSERYIECFEDVEYNINCILKDKNNIYIGDKVSYHYESQTRNKSDDKLLKLSKDAYDTLMPFINRNSKKIHETGLVHEYR